jgi:hypothetical protein
VGSIPDGLIHNAEIFGIRLKSVLSGRHIGNVENTEADDSYSDQASCDPEPTRPRHRFWCRIEAQAISDIQKTLAPKFTTHAPFPLPHQSEALYPS